MIRTVHNIPKNVCKQYIALYIRRCDITPCLHRGNGRPLDHFATNCRPVVSPQPGPSQTAVQHLSHNGNPFEAKAQIYYLQCERSLAVSSLIQ